MTKPRNFVTELKDKAKVLRKQSEAPDDFNGILFSTSEEYVYILEYAEGFLSGALVLGKQDLPGFAAQLQSTAEFLTAPDSE